MIVGCHRALQAPAPKREREVGSVFAVGTSTLRKVVTVLVSFMLFPGKAPIGGEGKSRAGAHWRLI